MIPSPKALLVLLSAASFTFLLMLTDAAAGDGASIAHRRHLGEVTYLLLPFLFYLLMRSRRRRPGPGLLWASSRHRSLRRHRAVTDTRSPFERGMPHSK
jgi:hypothetical protein